MHDVAVGLVLFGGQDGHKGHLKLRPADGQLRRHSPSLVLLTCSAIQRLQSREIGTAFHKVTDNRLLYPSVTACVSIARRGEQDVLVASRPKPLPEPLPLREMVRFLQHAYIFDNDTLGYVNKRKNFS